MIAASRMRNGLGRWNWTHNDLGWLVSLSFHYCNLVILSLILLLKTIISENTEKPPTKYFINPFSSMTSLIEISQFTYSSKLHTAQKMKFPITDFFSKRDQIRSFLRIWSHLRKKSVMENFIFCAVTIVNFWKMQFYYWKHLILCCMSQNCCIV